MLRFDIITIFPEFFREAIDGGILERARNAGLVEVKAHDLRQWTTDKHHVVDDRPFGGGDGMILKPEPIFAGQHVVADRDFISDQLISYSFVDSFVASTKKNDVGCLS